MIFALFFSQAKRHLFFILLIFSLTFLTYWGVTDSFFEQDEWHSFGYYIYLQSLSFKDFVLNLFRGGITNHFTPFSLLFKLSLYNIFIFNTTWYFVISIFLHSLVAISVYYLAYYLFKNRLISFLCGNFFAVNSGHYQAVTWLGNFEGTELSAFFGLLSIILLIAGNIKKNEVLENLSLVSLFISLFFKETILGFVILYGLIVTYPSIAGLTANNKGKKLIKLFLVLLIYLFLRFSFLLTGVTSPHPAITLQANGKQESAVVYNGITLPFKFLTMSFIPSSILNLSIEKGLPFVPGTVESTNEPAQQLLKEKVYRRLSVVLGVVIFCLIFFCTIKKQKRHFLLGTAIIVAAVLPLLAIKVRLLFPDSRYLYVANIGTSLLFGALLSLVFLQKSRTLKLLVLVLASGYLLLQIYSLENMIAKNISEGNERRHILSEINNFYSDLPDKVIFYSESDASFYGLPEQARILPFQSGFGQTLLVWYQIKEQYPKDFFTSDFLWGISDQGYKEHSGRGFGYFRDFDQLARTLKENSDDQIEVIGLRYDSTEKRVFNSSSEVKGRLLGYLSQKQEVGQPSFRLVAQDSFDNLPLAKDGKRETAWRTSLPYSVHQSIDIYLDVPKEIVEIDIDVYNNKDQNQVGFSVSVSSNGEDWQDLFYSKRYTPVDGIIRIYLDPTPARILKVKQIGSHAYAPWVVHELLIYEKVD